jgi:hypothetical protein
MFNFQLEAYLVTSHCRSAPRLRVKPFLLCLVKLDHGCQVLFALLSSIYRQLSACCQPPRVMALGSEQPTMFRMDMAKQVG